MSVNNELLVEGGIYYHEYSLINDSNILCDFDGNPLILYTRNGQVVDVRSLKMSVVKTILDPVGVLLGSFKIVDEVWVYESINKDIRIEGISFNDPDGLLKTEALVSKHYIPIFLPLETADVDTRTD